MSKDNHLVALECGNGWRALIEPLVALANEHDATIMQIKEKFGLLRVYYDPDQMTNDRMEDAVDRAEGLSGVTCEMCGAPGKLMTSGHWLKTLCANDALQLGYKKRA